MFNPDSKYSKAIIYLALIIAILYGIARNLEWFKILMPTTVGINILPKLMLDLHELPHRLYFFSFLFFL